MVYNEEILSKDYSTIGINQLTKHLNLDEDLVDEDYLETLIESATDWCEERTNSYLTETSILLTIYDLDSSVIRISKGNISKILSVKVDGIDTEIPYKLIKHSNSASIIFDARLHGDKIEIEYEAGNKVKNNYLHAILIKAADFYDIERSDYSHGMNNNNVVMRLLNLM